MPVRFTCRRCGFELAVVTVERRKKHGGWYKFVVCGEAVIVKPGVSPCDKLPERRPKCKRKVPRRPSEVVVKDGKARYERVVKLGSG